MPILDKRFPFTTGLIAGAPEQPGVYILWEHDEAIYVGCALVGGATIRARLIDHFAGHPPCTRGTTHYSWEITREPKQREAELLAAIRRRQNALPRCNAA
jgi:hypothetical protein